MRRAMEFELSLIILSLVMAAAATLLAKRRNSGARHDLRRVPGPRRLPLIGNLHFFLRNSPPHRIFRELSSKYGPLMRLQLGEVPFLVVSSVEAAREVLRTQDAAFANRPVLHVGKTISYNYTSVASSPYGDYWRHVRKICTLELLSARRVRSFRRVREEENRDLAEWIASNQGSPVGLSERIHRSSFDIISRASVGMKTDESPMFTAAIEQLLKLASAFTIPDLYPSVRSLPAITGLKFKIRRIFGPVDIILQKIIDDHRADDATGRSEDLVDVLLKHQQDGAELHLTDDNIKAVITDMFLAGGDTSAITVNWAISEMIRNPSILKKAQDEVREVFDKKGYVEEDMFDELKYLKVVIKETLRLHPALPLIVPRINSERCEINGYEIPSKTRVMINAWALGRDPKYWNDAEKFKPERFEEESSSIDFKGNNLEYIPFGSGRRMCPGMSFGLANVEFPLATLLYYFDWKMPEGMKNEEVDMSEDLGVTVRRKHDLLLIPTLRRSLKTL